MKKPRTFRVGIEPSEVIRQLRKLADAIEQGEAHAT